MADGRLYLLRFAGGGPGCYRRLTDALDGVGTVELGWAAERYHGPGGIAALAADLADQVAADLAARPVPRYGVFGHSMGALVALEVAAVLRERAAIPQPVLLGVSGRVPPRYGARPAADPDDPASVAAYLRSCGGDLAAAAADPEFVELAAERLRADIGLGVSHRHVPRPALGYPVLAFGGLADPLGAPAELLGWLDHGTGGSAHLLPGAHWFLWDHAALVAHILNRALSSPPELPVGVGANAPGGS